MEQYNRKVVIKQGVLEEFRKLPKPVKESFDILIRELAHIGTLRFPDARKITGYDFYEMRVKNRGYWRLFYMYTNDTIIIIGVLNKKTKKTPLKLLDKLKRISYEHK